MNEMYLHRDDLVTIKQFLDTFPDRDVVLVTCDNSSGIGSLIKAHVIGATVNGHVVTVTKDIVDESSW
jgi:hypothetical protein